MDMKKIMIVVGLLILICGHYLCSWATTNIVPSVSNDVEAAMVTQTSSYYAETYKLFNDQYARLLWTLAFFITVFGFLMPFIGHFFQRQNLKEERERMLDEARLGVAQMLASVKDNAEALKTQLQSVQAQSETLKTELNAEKEETDKDIKNTLDRIEEFKEDSKNLKEMEQSMMLYGGYLHKDFAFSVFEASNNLAALSSSLQAIISLGQVKCESLKDKAERNIGVCFEQLQKHELPIKHDVEHKLKDSTRMKDLVEKALSIDYITNDHKDLLVRIKMTLNEGSQKIKS
jgi:DNA repair exonuclease SbcCD ATPase subunit